MEAWRRRRTTTASSLTRSANSSRSLLVASKLSCSPPLLHLGLFDERLLQKRLLQKRLLELVLQL